MSAARSWEGLISRPQILLYAGAPNEFLPPCSHEKVFVDFSVGGAHEVETGAIGIAARPVEVVEKAECGIVWHAIARRWDLDAAEIAAGIARIWRGIARIKNGSVTFLVVFSLVLFVQITSLSTFFVVL